MLNCSSSVLIELEAANLAIEWKSLFGRELMAAAIELSDGTALINEQHYRRALPVAIDRTLSAIRSQITESSHAASRAA